MAVESEKTQGGKPEKLRTRTNVGITIIHHPFGNGQHTNYLWFSDWGMVYDIGAPTLVWFVGVWPSFDAS